MVDRDDKRRPVIDDVDPDAPPSAEEVAASARLREALDDPSAAHPDADLARSLRAAFDPAPISAEEHASIVDDLPAAEEIALAERLRAALDGGEAARDERAELAFALRAAWSPAAIDPEEHRAIVARAVGVAGGEVVPFARRARVVRVAVVVTTGVVALAASVLIAIGGAPRAEAPLARARSTQPLFAEPFKAGETSARIDRIAVARASDYRDNRFAKWGVR